MRLQSSSNSCWFQLAKANHLMPKSADAICEFRVAFSRKSKPCLKSITSGSGASRRIRRMSKFKCEDEVLEDVSAKMHSQSFTKKNVIHISSHYSESLRIPNKEHTVFMPPWQAHQRHSHMVPASLQSDEQTIACQFSALLSTRHRCQSFLILGPPCWAQYGKLSSLDLVNSSELLETHSYIYNSVERLHNTKTWTTVKSEWHAFSSANWDWYRSWASVKLGIPNICICIFRWQTASYDCAVWSTAKRLIQFLLFLEAVREIPLKPILWRLLWVCPFGAQKWHSELYTQNFQGSGTKLLNLQIITQVPVLSH